MSNICPNLDLNIEINQKTYKGKPFLKWAGGKTQLLEEFNFRLPKYISTTRTIENYVEPFVGGGAMFFFLKRNYHVKKSVLIDINRELIIGYKVIQKNPHELIQLLAKIEKDYLKLEEKQRKEFYYNVRQIYNKQIKGFPYDKYHEAWIERAAQLIFLNKTCFNGLFRQNKKGEFNVPFGRYKNPKICDYGNIMEVYKSLEDTLIICGDFTEAEKYIKKNTFVYFDPPYRPLNKTSNFTSYNMKGFSDIDQIKLARFYKNMHKTGAYLMLSNSDPKNYNVKDNFFDDLYGHKDFKIERVRAKRNINCDSSKRGDIKELIITNY